MSFSYDDISNRPICYQPTYWSWIQRFTIGDFISVVFKTLIMFLFVLSTSFQKDLQHNLHTRQPHTNNHTTTLHMMIITTSQGHLHSNRSSHLIPLIFHHHMTLVHRLQGTTNLHQTSEKAGMRIGKQESQRKRGEIIDPVWRQGIYLMTSVCTKHTCKLKSKATFWLGTRAQCSSTSTILWVVQTTGAMCID